MLFLMCYLHFLFYYLFYVNYYLCFFIKKCFVLVYNIGVFFLTFFFILSKWNFNLDLTELLTTLWTFYIVIFSINIFCSFPIFSVFYLMRKPLKEMRNVKMHRKEIKIILSLIIFSFCSSHGIFISVIYIIFMNIISYYLDIEEEEKLKRYQIK